MIYNSIVVVFVLFFVCVGNDIIQSLQDIGIFTLVWKISFKEFYFKKCNRPKRVDRTFAHFLNNPVPRVFQFKLHNYNKLPSNTFTSSCYALNWTVSTLALESSQKLVSCIVFLKFPPVDYSKTAHKSRLQAVCVCVCVCVRACVRACVCVCVCVKLPQETACLLKTRLLQSMWQVWVL